MFFLCHCEELATKQSTPLCHAELDSASAIDDKNLNREWVRLPRQAFSPPRNDNKNWNYLTMILSYKLSN